MHSKDGRKADFLVKVIIIGDSGVGKTNLITRFCENHFKDTYVATIGVDFKIKSLTLNDKKFKMQIWDTAGQERFKNITQTYYKGAAGIILTYSTTDTTSFSNIERWMTQIESNAPENVSKVLVATKEDLVGERCVSVDEGKELAAKHGIPFLEVSAKTGFQVKEAFETLGKEILKTREDDDSIGLSDNREYLSGSTTTEPNKKCAC